MHSLQLGYTAHASASVIYKRILHCRIYKYNLIGSVNEAAAPKIILTPEAVKNNAPSGRKEALDTVVFFARLLLTFPIYDVCFFIYSDSIIIWFCYFIIESKIITTTFLLVVVHACTFAT